MNRKDYFVTCLYFQMKSYKSRIFSGSLYSCIIALGSRGVQEHEKPCFNIYICGVGNHTIASLYMFLKRKYGNIFSLLNFNIYIQYISAKLIAIKCQHLPAFIAFLLLNLFRVIQKSQFDWFQCSAFWSTIFFVSGILPD